MQQNDMTITELLAVVRRRRWGLFLPAAVIFLAAVAVAMLLPSVYRSTATILIEEQEIPANLVQTTVTSYAEQRLKAIHQRIISTSRLLELIQRFNLYADLRDTYTKEQLVAKLREDIALDFINADVVDRRTGRAAPVTIAFTVSYDGRDPGKTQQVANALTSFFLEENLKDREKSAEGASAFLLDEADKVKAELADVDGKIATYKEQHLNELPEMLQVNMGSLHTAEAGRDRLLEQLSALREKEEYLQTQLVSIPRAEENKDKTAQRLKDLKLQLANLQPRFSEQYPDIIALKAEIADLESQTAQAVTTGEAPDNPVYITLSAQLASVRSEIGSGRQQVQEADRKIENFRRWIAASPRVEEGYRGVLNEREGLSRKLDELKQKHMEAKVAQGLEKEQKGERFNLVEPAQVPEEPSKPNRLAIVLIGIVLGAGAGVGVAALREFADTSFRSPEAMARATACQVLAIVPEILSPGQRRRQRLGAMAQVAGFFTFLVAVGLVLLALKVGWLPLG
ncbi:MAG: hypothetical protein A2521_02695 [Deltaproteobacteria bacterium RIFOXYD12_FULL_57_12]|nr:MAG: hypothetical protein A2521_02695 [Deltaproteobacteria bacterium RIFOXYD12_FULL_57_12]